MRRATAVRWLLGTGLILAGGGGCVGCMTAMPGVSRTGPLPPVTPAQREAAARLRADVVSLHELGERSTLCRYALRAAADRLAGELEGLGLHVERQRFDCGDQVVENIEAVLPGAALAERTLVLGAHYDSEQGTAGADDNASGCAALLELARRFAARDAAEPDFPRHTLRLVLFTNEEPPHFQRESMGSLVHARALEARGEQVDAMLSLECLGYYRDEQGSQSYPFPFSLFYPHTGNFLGFVGDVGSRALVRRCVGAFRASDVLPCEGVSAMDVVPGIGWSDQWSYWQCGYPGVMVTDTALFRNPHYHRASDVAETLDYDRMARVVDGLEVVALELDRNEQS